MTVGAATFRAGVVAVVRREDGLVLALERADNRGAWQFPQGGIDEGEHPTDAAWRELAEETGLDGTTVRLVSGLHDWIAYEWPADVIVRQKHGRIGQVQRWFLFGIDPSLDENEFAARIHPDGREFVDWRWMDPHRLVDGVVEWRRSAYARALTRLLP